MDETTPENNSSSENPEILSPEEILKRRKYGRGVRKLNILRKKEFVKGLLRGEKRTTAALSAGYSQAAAAKTGSRLMNDPLVKKSLERALKKYEITEDRLVAELDKGLKHGEIGKHDQYLDKAMKLVGMLKPETSGNDNISIVFANIIAAVQQRGLE
jgi:hypothetical protein